MCNFGWYLLLFFPYDALLFLILFKERSVACHAEGRKTFGDVKCAIFIFLINCEMCKYDGGAVNLSFSFLSFYFNTKKTLTTFHHK
jgi:hypothetical protein